MVGLMALIVIASALDIAVPFLTRGLVDQIVHSLSGKGGTPVRTLLIAGAAIFAATAMTRILRSFYSYRLMLAASQAEDEIKIAAFAHYLRLDTEFHAKVNTGEIVGALDRGCAAIFVTLNEILGQNLVPPLLIAVGVLISLLSRNVWIALMVFAPLPAYLAADQRIRSPAWRSGTRGQPLLRKFDEGKLRHFEQCPLG